MIGLIRRGLYISSFALLAIALSSCREQANIDPAPSRFDGATMGTTYSVLYADSVTEQESASLQQGVAALLAKLDKQVFSTYASNSELSRLNAAPVGVPVAVSSELFDVLVASQKVSAASDGAFDPTVGPLVNLWGFGPGRNALNTSVPPDDEVAAALSQVDYQAIVLDEEHGTVTRLAPVVIDLSAIAKGFGVDAVADYLESRGVKNYFVEVGGELRIAGNKNSVENGWVPAIEAPEEGLSKIHAVLFTHGESIAVAGSGDYRNYFEQDGVRYSHEIDPRTGRPIMHTLAAVYVIDEQAMLADALATTYMILGPEEAFNAAENTDQAAYFIVRSGVNAAGEVVFESLATEEFERFLQE